MNPRSIFLFRLSGERRLTFDLVLANEPECEECAGEADEAGEGEHVVYARWIDEYAGAEFGELTAWFRRAHRQRGRKQRPPPHGRCLPHLEPLRARLLGRLLAGRATTPRTPHLAARPLRAESARAARTGSCDVQ